MISVFPDNNINAMSAAKALLNARRSLVVTIAELQSFIFDYISEYRNSYDRYTSLPPEGAGYPKHAISPFLISKEFEVYLANDGVLINEVAAEPDYQWYIAGGPALKVDFEPTKTPPEVTQIIKDHGLKVNQLAFIEL
ncbi:hypothetical protein AB6D15_24580 [Vibrio splendidus]